MTLPSVRQPEDLMAEGRRLEKQQRPAESAIAYAAAAAAAPSIAAFTALARVQLQLHRHEDAAASITQVLAQDPRQAGASQILAKIKLIMGDRAGAAEVLRNACGLDPTNIDLALAYVNILDQDDEGRALQALEEVRVRVATEPAKVSRVLRRLTEIRERTLRKSAGLPLDGTLSWDDACAWRDTEGLRALAVALETELQGATARVEALVDRAAVAIAAQDWVTAERWLLPVRQQNTGSIFDVITFAPTAFSEMANMDPAGITADLPPVETVIPAAGGADPSLFLASDPKYFEWFTVPLLREMNGFRSSVGVHVHVMDGDMAEWRRLAEIMAAFPHVKIGFTAEASGAGARYGKRAKDYYHAIRFVRFYQHLMQVQGHCWLMDVDAHIHTDPAALLAKLEGNDICFHGWAGVLDPWGKIAANLVGLAPNSRGREYARMIAAYICYWNRRTGLRWGIDQAALFACYAHLQKVGVVGSTHFLQGEAFGRDGLSGSVFDFDIGEKKFRRAAPSGTG